MIISLIVAMDRRGVIGAGGALPWRLSDDLRHFKAITMGKPLIMGRKTHESIARPLPGRQNIVLTRQRDYTAQGCTVVHDVEDALAAGAGFEEVMVMGGAAVVRAVPAPRRPHLPDPGGGGGPRRHLVPAVRRERLERDRTPGPPG